MTLDSHEFFLIMPEIFVLSMASLILVHNTSLTIRFRMDEKRFDVDGTYNARYEIIKKRIDKAYIKGTRERLTQAGKMVIVYAQKKDEQEYLRYIAFLKAKGVKEADIMENYTPFGHSDWQSIVSDIKKFGSTGKKTAVRTCITRIPGETTTSGSPRTVTMADSARAAATAPTAR